MEPMNFVLRSKQSGCPHGVCFALCKHPLCFLREGFKLTQPLKVDMMRL